MSKNLKSRKNTFSYIKQFDLVHLSETVRECINFYKTITESKNATLIKAK